MKPVTYVQVIFVLVAAQVSLPAQLLEIAPSGGNVVLTWEGNGLLQSASGITGPWTDDLEATSPHRVSLGTNRLFFRVWYPNGVIPLLEPPTMAFGEPNARPAALAMGLSQPVRRQPHQLPEPDDEVLVQLFSGEVQHAAVDLHIKGRGLDFIWGRRYRSRTGPNSAQGNRWDYSYNVHIERAGPHVRVFDGNGRADLFFLQPNGSYAANQFFREGRFEANGVFVLTFADTGVWRFFPFEGRPRDGRIMEIADRNGNALSFAYDSLGRLTNVTDTLGRSISVAYDGNGFIESVTDFIGRQVRYQYYSDPEPGGSFGDLKSVRSPIVTNTPTMNDFPSGKITTYAYSEGFIDEHENHLLISITDPKGQTSHEFVYQHNQSNLDFLHCQTMRLGYSSNLIQFHYVGLAPASANHFAVRKAIVNDRMGNVGEQFYDAANRLVLLRQYTGRADPGQPSTDLLNRPMNPLRTNDPPFFETTWDWNPDSLPTRVVYPNGNSVSNLYELALNPEANRRARGNLRERRFQPGPLGGDQSEIVQSFEHDSKFGSHRPIGVLLARKPKITMECEDFILNCFPTKLTDPRDNSTFRTYDERGNCTNVVHRIPTIVEDFTYNQFGQLTTHMLPDNGSGHRRRDVFTYYTGGPLAGYLYQQIRDFDPNGMNQTTTYGYNAVGNPISITDPRGNNSLFAYNSLDQLVRAESRQTGIAGGNPFRQKTDYFYDKNDNLVRVCESNADELGRLDPDNAHVTQLYEYDILDRPVRICAESGTYDVPRNPPKLDCSGLPASEFITIEYEYDANGSVSLVRSGEASEGRQPANTVRTFYDERDLPFRIIRAEGDAAQSSTQHDYDRGGNMTITFTGLEAVPRVTRFVYDGYHRLTEVVDAMGNVFTRRFDPNGNLAYTRIDGETNDIAGSMFNVRLSEVTNDFDSMDRLTRRDAAFFDTSTGLPIDDGISTTSFAYSDSGQLLTRVDDNNHTNRHAYDRLHRSARSTDARGNELLYDYDANSNPATVSSVEKSDLGNPDQTFATRHVYDARDRLIQVLDNVSNSVQYAYDSRNNLVLTTDPLGVQTRRHYDAQSRQITIIQDMNNNGPVATDLADIMVGSVWDDSFRLVQQTDDNTNATTYVYDALNRRIREMLADGTGKTNSYDVHDNLRTVRDANRNAVTLTYDLLNRLTNKIVVAGPGVSPDTTFERFRYDGLSRLLRAEDDDSLVELSYNSLGKVPGHRLNGQTTSAAYDGEGNVLSSTYPGGRVVQFAYDELNRIKSITGVLDGCHYIGPDRLERRNLANGTQTDFSYDGISGVPNSPEDFGVKQLIRTRHTLASVGTVIDDRTYTWSRRYSKTSRSDVRPGGPTQLHQYAFDAADRLVRGLVTHPSLGILRNTSYTLDGVGNRTSVTNLGGTSFYALDTAAPLPADFQVNQYTATPLDTRQYDENGNLRALNPGGRSERLVSFDYADRLIRLIDTDNGVTNVYAYDALGRRIQKSVITRSSPAQTTRYCFGADSSSHPNWWQVVEEQNELGDTLATFVHGGGLDIVLNMQRGGDDHYFHHDDLGSVMAVTDAGGKVAERYDYGDFGSPEFFDGAGSSRSGSAIGNPYLFTGRRHDGETGFYYFRNRYLDPDAGRFITRDPLGTWGDPANAGNGLAYVGNNPWTHTDPMGLGKEVFVPWQPHVNIGNGDVNRNSAAGGKPKEIVVVGSKTKPGFAARRNQSLYFPESMLEETKSPASSRNHRPPVCIFQWGQFHAASAVSRAHGHLDFLKKVGDPATGVPPAGSPTPLSVVPTSSPVADAGTHEVGHWMGLYHTLTPGAAADDDVDGRDFLLWQRNLGSSPMSGSDHHPDFLWYPTGISVQVDGAILVVSAADGPMPWPAVTVLRWFVPSAPKPSSGEVRETIEICVGYSDNFLQ